MCYEENRAYGLYAIFNYTDGNSSGAMMASFNPDTNGWQYTATAIVAEKDYSSITVYACYDRGANTVYFDGIQLFKEAFGTSYTYDPETGDVISVVDLQNKTTAYEYDDDGNLTQIMQDDKVKMTYTYDDWHNVETATTEEGLSYAFEYDTFGNNTKVSIVSDDVTISSSADYTDDGNRLESVTDALGNTTTYSYNADTNVLEWVQYPEDTEATRTNYTYDNMYRMATAAATTDSNLSMSASYTYTDDYLTQIQTPTTTYNFTYGNFGLRSSVKVGSQNLATYTYDSYNRLEKLDYGNQDSVEYTYDAQGRVTQETYEDGATVTYSYDNTGALATVTDSETGITTTYYYDLIDRLVKYEEKGNDFTHSVTYIYDEKNNLSSLTEVINDVKTVYTYAYDNDNRVTSVTVGNGTTTISSVSYTYDAFGRVSQQVTKHGDSTNGTTVLTESATFTNPSTTSTSGQIASYNGFTYTYDDNGNITSVAYGGKTTTYEYDSANQLTRENNQQLGITQTWTYDNAGNILNRKEYTYTTGSLDGVTPTDTVAYTYGNSNWGDLLTAYDGATISYDQIGNPTKFGNWSMEWQHGRQLASMTAGTTTWEYTYNADSLRTKRTNGTTTYNYVYNGSQLAQMTVGNDTLTFAYDASGRPFTITWNGTVYYYSTNLQGDVIAILDSTGATVVTYTYTAWGDFGNMDGTLASTLGTLNPLRYRGYVYDNETYLYYLQSRYYDPYVGRFINADVYTSTGQGLLGNNMFAYCRNNPVKRKDASGTEDECVDNFNEDDNPLNDLGNPTGSGGGGRGLGVKSSYYVSQNVRAYDWSWQNSSYNPPSNYVVDPACFIAGTLVQCEEGTKPIEQIETGDYVWAWDEETADIALKEVVETYINETDELIHIFVSGEEIITTPSHPFYSPVKGWTDAVHLRAGDILVLVNGEYVVVEQVQHEILETPVTVYNFHVADYHTYYVANAGVLVHNSCGERGQLKANMLKEGPAPGPNYQAHHGLPWKNRDYFDQAGLNVNDARFGRWVIGGGNGGHQSWSYRYGSLWDNYITRHPIPDALDIIDYFGKLNGQ